MSLKISIPDQALLNNRFSFIKDETQRTNTVITFQYIIFLITLEQNENLPGTIIYSIYKDIIVHTGTVVEGCVHYTLKTFFEKNIIKSREVMEEEWREEKSVVIEKINEDKQIFGVVRHKSAKKLERHTNFVELNRTCLRARIYSNDVFEKAEKLREARNKIHLAGLSEVDDLYKKGDVDRHFEYARIVLNCLEENLKKIL